jgi:hypothetical protein
MVGWDNSNQKTKTISQMLHGWRPQLKSKLFGLISWQVLCGGAIDFNVLKICKMKFNKLYEQLSIVCTFSVVLEKDSLILICYVQ